MITEVALAVGAMARKAAAVRMGKNDFMVTVFCVLERKEVLECFERGKMESEWVAQLSVGRSILVSVVSRRILMAVR